MKFSLNLACILTKMANEYDEPLTDYIDWRKVADKLLSGEIRPYFEEYTTGTFMVIDVPVDGEE